jgi:hypothetical protein
MTRREHNSALSHTQPNPFFSTTPHRIILLRELAGFLNYNKEIALFLPSQTIKKSLWQVV